MQQVTARVMVVVLLGTALSGYARTATAQFRAPPPPPTPVEFTRLDDSSLHIPLLGFAIITKPGPWGALWTRFDRGDSSGKRKRVPAIDFSHQMVLVFAARGHKCADDHLIRRVFIRGDTVQVDAAWPQADARGRRATPCRVSPGSADAIVIERTKRPIRCVFNAVYATLVTDAPWWDHHTLADLDTLKNRDAREGWFEVLAREDSSIENLRRMARDTSTFTGPGLLLSIPQVQRDPEALIALARAWPPRGWRTPAFNAESILVARFGLALARNAATPRPTLNVILDYLQTKHEPSEVAAAIWTNPGVADDLGFRERLADSGLLPGGALAGTVRDTAGKGRADIIVSAAAAQREKATNYDGSFMIQGVRPGPVRLVAYLTPVDSADTTVTVRDRDTVRWNPVIADHYSHRQRPKLARYPGDDVDSAGRGLLKVDTASIADFAGFSRRFVVAAMREAPPTENRVISPVSAAMALSLLLEGARGATATAISSALGMSKLSDNERQRRITGLRERMSGRVDVQLAVADAVWADVAVKLAPDFQRTAETVHQAAVRTMPLATQAAAVAVNHWADSVTFGRIPVIQSGPFGDSMRLFLANAVYFNGAWLDKFEATDTRPRPFAVAGGEPQYRPAMEQTKRFGYLKAAGYQIVRLPYRAGKTAMYIVLPDRSVSRDELLGTLSAAWPGRLGGTSLVHLQLPRMHVEQTVDLKSILASLGLGVAFDDQADLSGMGTVTRGPKHLAVGAAGQSVFLDVNEDGTEAAAVTSVGVVSTSAPMITEFIVDRPFLFILRDESTGADLFVGWIAKP